MSSSSDVASQSALCALEANVAEVVGCKLTSPSVTAGKIAALSDKFSCNETSLGHSIFLIKNLVAFADNRIKTSSLSTAVPDSLTISNASTKRKSFLATEINNSLVKRLSYCTHQNKPCEISPERLSATMYLVENALSGMVLHHTPSSNNTFVICQCKPKPTY